MISRDEMRKIYEETLAGVQRRYDELYEEYSYRQRKKDPFLDKRILQLEDIIYDLYTAIRLLS